MLMREIILHNKHSVLKQYFGYDSFREGQEQLIDSIISGRDVIGIMPTGAGKSVCYQVPAILLDGVTVVISPLISLMKDQVNALTQVGIRAAYINSSLTEKQNSMALNNARNGLYKLIYVAPERLNTAEFLDFARTTSISMITIDEAHCISQWGQDFRPGYLRIEEFIEKLPNRPVVSAFTATATPKVQEDIRSLLKLRNTEVLVTGFDRKNLYFEVRKPENQFRELLKFLSDKKDRFGIVYCSTRDTVDELTMKLNAYGFSTLGYHAGLSVSERQANQDAFLFDQVQIMVATNAFGMGIDKSNVSFVVHYNMPKNIESYYQEAGRAGRDGGDAECILFYNGKDIRTNTFLIENGRDSEQANSTIILEQNRKKLKEMTLYCQTNDCLRNYLLNYFAEATHENCGNCGSCNSGYETVDVTEEAKKILNCVSNVNEKFGTKMIVDILRGSKNKKIISFGFNKLDMFDKSNLPEIQLREIMNYLLLNDYLFSTNGEYPIIQLSSLAPDVLHDGKKIEMKMTDKIELSISKNKSAVKGNNLSSLNEDLFNRLKELRFHIAQSQRVPAFVVFSDSSLIDMCMKLPKNDEEFLDVSGVGEVKLEKYGKVFIEAINGFISKTESEKDEESIAQGMPLEKEESNNHDLNQIEIFEENVMISWIADRINTTLMQNGLKRITAAKINDWLISEGMLVLKNSSSNKNFKVATTSGEELGITTEERIIRDELCYVNMYNQHAQKHIIDHLDAIIRFTLQ